jgi:hypothetical protein
MKLRTITAANVLALAFLSVACVDAPTFCYGGTDLAYIQSCLNLDNEYRTQEGR